MKEQDVDLTADEQEALHEYEHGLLKSTENLDERKEALRQAARNTQNKTRNINIRLSEKDLNRLKARAAKEGIPYQTLVSSILHKATASYRAASSTTLGAPAFFTSILVESSNMNQTFKENDDE